MAIKILQLGLGNVRSVASWIRRSGLECKMVEDLENIDSGDTLVLCGVGNTVEYVSKLRELDFDRHIINKDLESRMVWSSGRAKIVGICAGFQALCQEIEEDGSRCKGLGMISGRCQPITRDLTFHNGWRSCSDITGLGKIVVDGADSCLREDLYFNHSGAVYSDEESDHFLHLANEKFKVGFVSKNIIGMQFHPEKSGTFGDFLCRHIFNV